MVVFSRTSVLLVVLTVLFSPFLQTIKSVVGYNATFIKQLANLTAEPCEDFYGYVCGNFNNVYRNPQRENRVMETYVLRQVLYDKLNQALRNTTSTSRAVSIAQKYFKHCLNFTWEDQLSLLRVIEEFGYWPIYQYNKNSTLQQRFNELWDINDYLIKASKYNVFPLIEIDLNHDQEKKIDVTKPFFEEDEEEEEENTKEKLIFKLTVEFALKKLRNAYSTAFSDANEPQKELSDEDKETIANMYRLKIEITRGIKSYYDAEDSDHKADWGKVDLLKVISFYFNTSITSNATIAYEESFFQQVPNILKKYSKKTVASYIVWEVVYNLIGEVANRKYQSYEDLDVYLAGNQFAPHFDEKKKQDECISETMFRFHFATSRLYYNKSAPDIAESMFELIKSEAKEDIYDFFDDDTWDIAYSKLNKLNFQIFYPRFIFNDSAFENYYQKYNSSGDYLSMIIQYALFRREIKIWEYNQEKPDLQYLLYPFMQTYLETRDSKLQMDSTNLLEPLFYSAAPPEVQFGGLGSKIGYKVLANIVYPGASVDDKGRQRYWWSQRTINKFNEARRCFIDHYFTMFMFTRRLDAEYHDDFAIQDAGGLFLAYKALEKKLGKEELNKTSSYADLGLTKAQAFFFSYAQTMCSDYHLENSRHIFPGHDSFHNLVMMGTLKNSQEFTDAFKCKNESAYNLAKKCRFYD